MKKIIVLLLLVCLCGCKTTNLDNINNELDEVFSNTENISYYRINNNMPYYSYYLPSDAGEDELDSDSIVLKYGESKIIMNLNIKDIVNSKYYSDYRLSDDGFFVPEYMMYENIGQYKNLDGLNKDYIYRLYNYDGQYVLHLQTNDMNYYGSVASGDIRNATRCLLTIAKNTSINYDSIIADFSNKDVIDYKRKQIDLFDNSLPTSGELASMLLEGATIGDQKDNVDNNETKGEENTEEKIAEE